MPVMTPPMHSGSRARPPAQTVYHVVELPVVTDEAIAETLNANVAEGWIFESMHFAMWEGSKRPSMAFLIFVRPVTESGADAA